MPLLAVRTSGRWMDAVYPWDLIRLNGAAMDFQGQQLVGSVEKANDIVRCARLWIDAGYTAPKFRRAAIETLGDEHAVALAEGSEDVTKVLADALTAIESGLSDKKEMVPAIASEKISEALRLAQEGRAKDAIGILTLAIFDPRIKRLPKSIRDQIVQLRDKIKAESTS